MTLSESLNVPSRQLRPELTWLALCPPGDNNNNHLFGTSFEAVKRAVVNNNSYTHFFGQDITDIPSNSLPVRRHAALDDSTIVAISHG